MTDAKLHIHLDPVGGVAGDMFAAALLDLFPDQAPGAIAAIRAAGLDDAVGLDHVGHNDGILAGSRFLVELTDHDHDHNHGHHHHVHWGALRGRLEKSALDANVKAHAIGIFSLLAIAEAEVHGKSVDDVAFHEVGAWDSIADIVAAAYLVTHLPIERWSIAPLPVGSGTVNTQHGELPVPAPATALLLRDFTCFDDGIPGERVTPTGAAIVKHLSPDPGIGNTPLRLIDTGYGFGTRRLPGKSNVLRAVAYEITEPSLLTESVAVVEFELDDQTPEALAVGLEHLRHCDGVLDVGHYPMIGKQGRMMTAVRVLARNDSIDAVTERCFRETTTIGLRVQSVTRRVLPRHESVVGGGINVKVVERPTGPSAKADISSVASDETHTSRESRRRQAEDEALKPSDS